LRRIFRDLVGHGFIHGWNSGSSFRDIPTFDWQRTSSSKFTLG
jgi:hypothetical protein